VPGEIASWPLTVDESHRAPHIRRRLTATDASAERCPIFDEVNKFDYDKQVT
jgi:hypothetical protein